MIFKNKKEEKYNKTKKMVDLHKNCQDSGVFAMRKSKATVQMF